MYDVIVIGAGPAGLMASITAASNNKVLLIEKNNKIGKKLEITGGGRCNLTNLKSVNEFINEIPVNSKMLYSTLTNFGPKDIYNYFNNLDVKLKVELDDKVFPVSNKSRSIIDALYNELINNKVELHLDEVVESIEIDNDMKIVKTNKDIYKTKNIIIATGGLSYTNTGSTGDGYTFAKSINQNVTELYPAETFLITKDVYPLAGITIENVNIKINNITTSGSLLFTHIGLSGPAVFKISEYVYKQLLKEDIVKIFIDFIPNISEKQLLNNINNYDQKKDTVSFIREFLPKRLADYLSIEFENINIGQLSKIKRQQVISILKNYEVNIKNTGTIEQSFVTGGGIDMKNINSKTMESNINKGIYFIGEVLDIHGHTGGYNITLALSTGYTAGISINN